MEIRANNLKAVQNYFNEKLHGIFPEIELMSLFKIVSCEILNLPFGHPLDLNALLSESELLEFISVTKDLKKQKPIQYIFNKAPFWNMDLYVDEHVLIPRPETEELVDLILKTLKSDVDFNLSCSQQGFGLNILDIGTGSGCIALALKKELPQSFVTALDTSYEAIKVALKNSEKFNLEIHPVCADISRDYSSQLNYHIVVSNPPYVTPDEKHEMRANVLNYEPHLALFTPDQKPLYFYEIIIAFAVKNLVNGGWLFFEINRKYGEDIVKLLSENNFDKIELLKDLTGNNRMIKAKFVKLF